MSIIPPDVLGEESKLAGATVSFGGLFVMLMLVAVPNTQLSSFVTVSLFKQVKLIRHTDKMKQNRL